MDTMTLIMSGIVALMLIGVVIYINYTAKKSNLTIGEVINQMFFREGATFIILLLVFMNVIEAITAASVHKVGANVTSYVIINPVTRFLMHLILGFSGAFFSVYTTKALLDLIKSLSGEVLKKKPLLWLLDLLLFAIALPLSFGLPYINVFIISVATQETELFKIAVYQWFTFWKTNAQLGIPNDFSAVSNMSVVMTSSFFALFAHYFVSIVDGIIALKDRYEFGLDVEDSKRKQKAYGGTPAPNANSSAQPQGSNPQGGNPQGGNPNPQPNNSQPNANNSQSNTNTGNDAANQFIGPIFDFLGVSSSKKNDYKNRCMRILSANADNEKGAAILNMLSEYTEYIKDFRRTSQGLDADSRRRNREQLVNDIRSSFSNDPADGGFGFDPVP